MIACIVRNPRNIKVATLTYGARRKFVILGTQIKGQTDGQAESNFGLLFDTARYIYLIFEIQEGNPNTKRY